MLNETSLAAIRPNVNLANRTYDCPVLTLGETKRPFKHNGELHWTAQDKAIIFASFYAGGLLATLLTEKLSQYCGPSRLILYGAIVNVFGTFATPFIATQGGPIALEITRFVMGFGQASVIVAMFATAELCQLPWGWPMAFHVYGILGCVLCVLWFVFVFDTPHDARCISQQEIEHITANKKKSAKKANWQELLRSPLIWSIAGSSFAHNYITVGTITYLPLYYKSALNMSLTSDYEKTTGISFHL
ncbi:hypothetical protein WR25_22388 [Diploscapter pachys]|uniref:Major facilitator superfamily (MFS) profile domain-containing protein n=1 Tax=Diploscapter pachys TaxID=2018661 RepID=A0A2A2L4P6_9BILA|nr:hypothetical protein WR25_22388 [Diploscapter pachys]